MALIHLYYRGKNIICIKTWNHAIFFLFDLLYYEYIKPKKIGKIQRLLKKKLSNLLEQCIKYFTILRKFNKI